MVLSKKIQMETPQYELCKKTEDKILLVKTLQKKIKGISAKT